MICRNRIILIAPSYFSYHNLIIKALEEKGNIVDFLEDKNSGFFYNISRKSSFLMKKYLTSYKKEVLNQLDAHSYDCMIVIGGKTLGADFWHSVSKKYSFKKILYQWDSVKNFDYRDMMPSFDLIKTFDSADAKTLGISYLPLFYKKEDQIPVNQDLDFVFIGIWHSDRIDILNKIADYANSKKLKYLFKVYHPWYIYFYMVYIKKSLQSSPFFIHKPVPLDTTISYYERAKCIIDINHPWQSGLTMRTIEAIGKGKKLLTTNAYIVAEEFYDPKMIQVIDRDSVIINPDFFEFDTQYKFIDRLEVDNWVDELLS